MNMLESLKARADKLNATRSAKYIVAFIEPVQNEADKKKYELDYHIYARNNSQWGRSGKLYFDTEEAAEERLLLLAEENNVSKIPNTMENWFLGTRGFDIYLCVCDGLE